MPSEVKVKGPASYFPSIEKTYGQPVTHWFAVLDALQGKSCFNFTKADPARFEELASLTQAGFDDYQAKGYV